VPGLQVNGKGTGTLATSLIHIARHIVEDPQHGNQAIGCAIRSANRGALCPDAMDVKSDAAGRLRDQGALFHGLKNALDRVGRHGQEEARRQLRAICGSGKKCWRRMSEVSLRQEIISFHGRIYVLPMDSDRHAHQHMLRTLCNFSVSLQQIGTF